MLGCVVWLTSSHLSGSTIRDVNTVGSVLCSNSSFSSLLSSTNTDPDRSNEPLPVSPAGDFTPDTFVDGTAYFFDERSGDQTTSATFTNCRFTGDKYQPSVRPLSFEQYPGTISILSCSFDNITSTNSWTEAGGAIYLHVWDQFNRICFTAKSTNFTSCSSRGYGGAMDIKVVDDILIDSCRFDDCSVTDDHLSRGGALCLYGYNTEGPISEKQFRLVACVFEDCTTVTDGAGLFFQGHLGLSIIDTTFEYCAVMDTYSFSIGGAISVKWRKRNIISSLHYAALDISDTLVKDCYSGTTGTIFILSYDKHQHHSFSHVLFVGNSVGDDTAFFTDSFGLAENTTKFTDVTIICIHSDSLPPTLQFANCFTTVSSDSSGMLKIGALNESSYLYDHERIMDPAFNLIGPLLTASTTVSMNEKTGKIELEMEGKTPLASQKYEVTVKENDGTETKLRMLFSDGTGVLVSGSEVNLLSSTTYTIISIVGVVPDSSSSRMANAIEVPVAAWAFNLAATPSFVSFSAPDQPPILLASTAHLTNPSQPFAYVILMFDRQVSGSFDIVVEEEGKDVTITVTVIGPSFEGESENFRVVGDDRLLTHDTTYTIKSLSPTPGTESTTTPVGMSKTITFFIPRSSFVPPEEPTDPEDPTTPEPEDTITVVVARGGSDSIAECGGEDSPCRTVWTGQMCGKGKGGEWMNVLVRGEAEMGEGFWILGKVGMLLSSESSTQRSRVVIGRPSFSSNDGIVSISSGTVQVRNLNLILPSSEERSSSGWVFVVESEGDLEMSSIGVIGEGEIGIGLAQVKSGIGRFNSVSMSSGSFVSGIGMIVGEGKWNSISMLICDFVVRDSTTSNSPLISFSSLSPESSFSMEGSRFQKTRRVIGSSLSDGEGLIEVSIAQSRTEISDCVFESSGVTDGTGTITRSALLITLNSSSTSLRTLVISSCLFLDSHTTLPLSGSLHIRVVSGHTTIVLQDCWFESTTATRLWKRFSSGIACLDWSRGRINSPSNMNGALIEYWDGLPIVVRRQVVFSNCKLVMSKKS